MADFCKQCSLELFGKDFKELANITTVDDVAQDHFACVLCEGCGYIQVDPEGNCIFEDCMKKGHKSHD